MDDRRQNSRSVHRPPFTVNRFIILPFQIFLYNIGVQSYHFVIWMASFFSSKAQKWIEGRRDIFEKLAKDFSKQKASKPRKIIWIHCASLGEFEQGRPIIEGIKARGEDWKILLTFYSPSGFEIRKNYEFADWIYYLPADSKENARLFLEIVQPEMAIFVKYEFWFHYLNQLSEKEIPTYLVSAIFRENQFFFKSYGTLHRKMLATFDHIFLQNENSFQLLDQINIKNKSIVGDTRIDRVVAIQKQKKSLPIIEEFCKTDKQILIAGSTWKEDEDILIPFINDSESANYKLIIAPHSISEYRIRRIENRLKVPFQKYSTYQADSNSEISKVLIIDNIGLLAFLYQFGKIAYIGGAFGSGLHSILEPAAAGIPIIFGSKYHKFQEARDLLKTGGAFSISDKASFIKELAYLSYLKEYQVAANQCIKYLNNNKGATGQILKKILDN